MESAEKEVKYVSKAVVWPVSYVPWFSISRGRANTLQARPALECAWQLFGAEVG